MQYRALIYKKPETNGNWLSRLIHSSMELTYLITNEMILEEKAKTCST